MWYLDFRQVRSICHLKPAAAAKSLQSCPTLENFLDRGDWWAAVHGVSQSQTRLKRLTMHAFMGEGNGDPLQYSCLENPWGRGA